jgi:repressor LexA
LGKIFMLDRSKLTPKQLRILEFIERECSQSGRVPTFRAIAQHFQLKAVGTVQDHISKLLDLGFLEKEKGNYRGFKLPFQTQTTLIPILGSVPAGKPIEAMEDFQGSIALSGSWRGDLFALRVRGESMRDRGILHGDLVVVRKQMDAEDGEIVVALVDYEATVKVLEKRKGSLRLLPANSDFKPIVLDPERENRIVGKVIAVQRVY